MLRNKIRYLVLLGSMGLLSILYNQYIMGILFLTILILPVILFSLLFYTKLRITAELVTNVHVANKGEMIPISVQLNNPTIFPISNMTIYLKYKNAYSPKQFKKNFSVSLDRRTNTSILCNILSEYAGNLEISLKGIRIFDYIKMWSLRKKSRGEVKVAILPCFHEIIEDYLTNPNSRVVESDYYSTVKNGDDPSEVFAIREYREGDRPQRIHWKLSVKQNQLMIKDFSDPLNCSVLAFVNLCVPPGEDALVYMDALLECALSLSYSFLMKRQIHYFSWYDEKHGACKRIRVVQEKDLFEAADGLLQSLPYSQKTDALADYLAEHPNDQYTDMFYVTGELSKAERLDSLLMVKANTKQIIYISDFNHILNAYDDSQYKAQIIPGDYMQRLSEMGIGLSAVDINNIKTDMEQLRLD